MVPGSKTTANPIVDGRCWALTSWIWHLVWLWLVISVVGLDRRSVQAKIVSDMGRFVTYECDSDAADMGVVRDTCAISVTRSMIKNRSIVFQSQLSQLKQIQCKKCQIGRLLHSVGLHFSMNVQTIDLSHSDIRSIAAAAISGTFRVLILSHNVLTDLNETRVFAEIPKLEALYLDHNYLNHLDELTFDGIPRLVRMYLSHNELTALPPRLFDHLPNLMSLRLDNNFLEVLEADLFAENPRLTELTLYDNRLVMVADQVWPRLHRIDMLDVDNVRQQIEEFKEVEYPEIETTSTKSHCDIGVVIFPMDAANLLNRSCSSLKQIPTDSLHGFQYKHINLRYNSISVVQEHSFGRDAALILTLDLAHNQISTIHPAAFNELIHLQVLLLSDNQISTLASTAFSNLGHLLVIELQNNALEIIENNLFWHNIQLKSLRLGNNRITEIDHHTFDQLQQLDMFEMSDNAIQNAVLLSINAKDVMLRNANVSYLSLGDRVQHVDASVNRIVGLNTKSAINLLELNVSVNHLVTMDLSTSKSLQMLDASDNRLGYLSFMHNAHLVDVDLSNNLITDARFDQAYNLQRLDLSGNSLESIYLAGQTLDLDKFNVSSNHTLKPFIPLLHLNISNNQVQSLEPFTPLYNLREFDASSNPLHELNDTTFQNMELLERLGLSNTQLTAIPADLFAHQSSLQYLDMSHNEISRLGIAALTGLKSVRVLRVDGNNLTTIDWRVIEVLPRLERIEISRNEWTCDALSEFVLMMEENFVRVPADLADVHGASVHGIRCNTIRVDEESEDVVENGQLIFASGGHRTRAWSDVGVLCAAVVWFLY